jgi:hypothetical protein
VKLRTLLQSITHLLSSDRKVAMVPSTPLQIHPVDLTVPALSQLTIVQVQPARMDFDVNDFAARSSVIVAVAQWLLGKTSAQIIEGKAPEVVEPPAAPLMLSFPELYIPVDVLLFLAHQEWQPGSIIFGGISPLQEKGPANDFFDRSSLEAVRKRLSEEPSIRVRNLSLLERLQSNLGLRGGKANLAATLAFDGQSVPNVVLHTKLVRSRYEETISVHENTVEGAEVFPIVIKSDPPRPRIVSILPLICSDFALLLPTYGRTLLDHWKEISALDVDLVSVANVQPCRDESMGLRSANPWPRQVSDQMQRIAFRALGRQFERSHVVLTNVGQIWHKAVPIPAGNSCLGILGPPSDGVRFDLLWCEQWNGGVVMFGNATSTAPSSTANEQWFYREQIGRAVKPNAAPHFTLIFPPKMPAGSIALGQRCVYRLGPSIGPGAFTDGEVFHVRKNEVVRLSNE